MTVFSGLIHQLPTRKFCHVS